jgi:hypothetical protein
VRRRLTTIVCATPGTGAPITHSAPAILDSGWFLTTPHCGHPVYQPAAKHRPSSPVCVLQPLEVPTHQLNEIQCANQPRHRKPVRHPR